MNPEDLKDTIKRELPNWLREDPAFRAYLMELTRGEFADRRETSDRFYDILGELRRDRERQEQKWAENNRKWDQNLSELRRDRERQDEKWAEQNRKWEENQATLAAMRKEDARKWEQNRLERERKDAEDARKWEQNRLERERKDAEDARKWEQNRLERERKDAEDARKWDDNQAELKRLHEQFMEQARKHDRGIGALGSRWGLQSEQAFRDALAAILEQSFDVQVVNVTEYDDTGEVFGRPDQIELDLIIKNGLLLICELKSSIDKAGMYSFERKARFYERHHQRRADRLIVISPMIDARARKVAERLGIETYGDSTEVESI